MTGQGGYLNFPNGQGRVAPRTKRDGLILRGKTCREHGVRPVHSGRPDGIVHEGIPLESTAEQHPYLVEIGVGLIVFEQHAQHLMVVLHHRGSNCHKLIMGRGGGILLQGLPKDFENQSAREQAREEQRGIDRLQHIATFELPLDEFRGFGVEYSGDEGRAATSS